MAMVGAISNQIKGSHARTVVDPKFSFSMGYESILQPINSSLQKANILTTKLIGYRKMIINHAADLFPFFFFFFFFFLKRKEKELHNNFTHPSYCFFKKKQTSTCLTHQSHYFFFLS
jgi:hypothetical protein